MGETLEERVESQPDDVRVPQFVPRFVHLHLQTRLEVSIDGVKLVTPTVELACVQASSLSS